MKVSQIGFNKCGTTSVNHFFLRNGYESVHWDHGSLALRLEDNYLHGKPLLSGYKNFDFYSDMEFVSSRCLYAFEKYYHELDRQYPDSLFILNTRPVEKWVESRLNHGNGSYLHRFEKIYSCDRETVIRRWKYEWHRHHSNVLQYFYGRKNFLLFDIEKDDGRKLKEFIGCSRLQASFYKHAHKTAC
ncbi:sulfotransferase [Microbulbifer sp. PAAF003]|uniref:sulfotransferase n=1 Tax=Microbulbifer sp. PAAF003 TaxID=3243375 RepID=UPI004039BCE4